MRFTEPDRPAFPNGITLDCAWNSVQAQKNSAPAFEDKRDRDYFAVTASVACSRSTSFRRAALPLSARR
jgi:hypothetical protein